MSTTPHPAFIAYVDEAGDDGLNTVRPMDLNGGSEWLMLAAVVIDARREAEAAGWVTDIRASLHKYTPQHLHFANTNIRNGRIICEKIADLPVRCFIVASNKKNMRRYINPFAAQIPSKNWFYCWLTRLLLERVTYFTEVKAIQLFGHPAPLRIELSERGRFSYGQLMAYYEWLKMKCAAGKNALPLGEISWSVMHKDLIEIHPNAARPGLQLADCVASSFYRACDLHHIAERDVVAAQALAPRMARMPDAADGALHGFGVKLMPKWGTAKLLPEQQEIFRHYGYPDRQWWKPK